MWRQLDAPLQPFGEAVWQYARHVVAQRRITGPREDTIKAAVDDLLDRASPPPGVPRPARNQPLLAASPPRLSANVRKGFSTSTSEAGSSL
jgi:putative transposase